MYKRNCEIKPGVTFPEGMQRVCLGLEYHGGHFHGFQMQSVAVETVQEALHHALSSIADEPISVVCAGRTDAGVHASQQIVHFDTLAQRPLKAWTRGANARLPEGIAINWARQVAPDFHARFSAQSRTYRYVVYNSDKRPALLSRLVTWQKRPLDLSPMKEAARHFLGEQDFSAFRASQCQAQSPIREVQAIRFAGYRQFLVLEITANAFLHHMVRNIVGTLFAIGCGDQPVTWAAELLAGRDRRRAAATAPADGLYLVNVAYPERFDLPRPPVGPPFLPTDLGWQQI